MHGSWASCCPRTPPNTREHGEVSAAYSLFARRCACRLLATGASCRERSARGLAAPASNGRCLEPTRSVARSTHICARAYPRLDIRGGRAAHIAPGKEREAGELRDLVHAKPAFRNSARIRARHHRRLVHSDDAHFVAVRDLGKASLEVRKRSPPDGDAGRRHARAPRELEVRSLYQPERTRINPSGRR